MEMRHNPIAGLMETRHRRRERRERRVWEGRRRRSIVGNHCGRGVSVDVR